MDMVKSSNLRLAAWLLLCCYAMLRNQICPILSESYIIHFSKCYRYEQFSSRRHISTAARAEPVLHVCSSLISLSFFITQCNMNTRSDKKYKILALLTVLSELKVHKKSINTQVNKTGIVSICQLTKF